MTQKDTVKSLVRTQGTLYSESMGANISRNTPQELFHWLLGALLLSARISSSNAVQAGKGLRREKLYKIDDILAAPRAKRIRVLNRNGYARFDNIGADAIHAAAKLVKEKYDGDLRRLREAAGGNEAKARKLLTEVKGVGKTGANIFLREAQWPWEEYYPRLDGPAASEAKTLRLPDDAQKLADLAGSRERFARVCAALTRASLEGRAEAVKKAAA